MKFVWFKFILCSILWLTNNFQTYLLYLGVTIGIFLNQFCGISRITTDWLLWYSNHGNNKLYEEINPVTFLISDLFPIPHIVTESIMLMYEEPKLLLDLASLTFPFGVHPYFLHDDRPCKIIFKWIFFFINNNIKQASVTNSHFWQTCTLLLKNNQLLPFI